MGLRGKRVAGVTLLELLVVITLMMSLLGLVGGSAIKSVERAQAQAELISVYSLIKKTSVRAFASGGGASLRFLESGVDIYLGETLRAQKNFEHLQFQAQELYFNRNGMPNSLQIEVTIRGFERSLELQQLFDNRDFNND